MDEDNAAGKTLPILAAREFAANNALVEVVDFLNKTLKREGYIFGVSKAGEKMTIIVYRADAHEPRE
jgi:hypothetical protein